MARSCAATSISRGSSIALLLAAIPTSQLSAGSVSASADPVTSPSMDAEAISASEELNQAAAGEEVKIGSAGIESDRMRLRAIANNASMLPFLGVLCDEYQATNVGAQFEELLQEASKEEAMLPEEKMRVQQELADKAHTLITKSIPPKPYASIDEVVASIRAQAKDIVGRNCFQAVRDRIQGIIDALVAMENIPVRNAAAEHITTLGKRLEVLTPAFLDAEKERRDRSRLGSRDALMAMLRRYQEQQEQLQGDKTVDEATSLASAETTADASEGDAASSEEVVAEN